MPPRIQLEEQRDFAGGLVLEDDPYNLKPNESFDLQNVDIDRGGGFQVRRGTRRFIDQPTKRTVTATGASRTANVVTATGLSPLNGDPDGLKPGQTIVVDFADDSYDGTFTVVTAAGGGSTATWAQTAADDASAGAGTITQGHGNPDSGYTYVDASNFRHILVARGGHVQRYDGAAWQDVLYLASSGRTDFVEMLNVLYILPPNGAVPSVWTGAGTATPLTTVVGNYNNDLTAPNNGNFPPSICIAVHKEVMWAGGVFDADGVWHDSRVRWSHPLRPQDWRDNDFIDLDPDDENGRIRALVPFGDRLLVFKDRAVYAIHGDPPSSFSVQNLTKQLGTPSRWAVRATEDKVYFWDIDRGLYAYDGKSFEWCFKTIYPLIDRQKINVAFSFQTIIEYHRDRVWVSAPFDAEPYSDKFLSLVYDPNAGKRGAWTLHTKTAFGWWIHRGSAGGDLHLLGGYVGSGLAALYEFDVEDFFQDQVEPGGTFEKIDAWYTTRWFDGRRSAVKKRWKRPVVIMRNGTEQSTLVEVLRDYDPSTVRKTFFIATHHDGDEGLWDVDNWDEFVWAREVTLMGDRSAIVLGSPLGSATAMALRFKNLSDGTDWRIHGLTMKWIDKRLRN